jgi:hypothetical protein
VAKPASGLDLSNMKDCPMPRFVRRSSRRLVAILALATTTAVPALVVIAGQTPAEAKVKPAVSAVPAVTTPVTMSPDGNKWH